MKKVKKVSKKFFVYILKCSDQTFYCGVAKNLEKRIYAHNFLKTGAKYTKSRLPVKLLYWQKYKNRSLAQKEEARIKALNKTQKENLILEFKDNTTVQV